MSTTKSQHNEHSDARSYWRGEAEHWQTQRTSGRHAPHPPNVRQILAQIGQLLTAGCDDANRRSASGSFASLTPCLRFHSVEGAALTLDPAGSSAPSFYVGQV